MFSEHNGINTEISNRMMSGKIPQSLETILIICKYQWVKQKNQKGSRKYFEMNENGHIKTCRIPQKQ